MCLLLLCCLDLFFMHLPLYKRHLPKTNTFAEQSVTRGKHQQFLHFLVCYCNLLLYMGRSVYWDYFSMPFTMSVITAWCSASIAEYLYLCTWCPKKCANVRPKQVVYPWQMKLFIFMLSAIICQWSDDHHKYIKLVIFS